MQKIYQLIIGLLVLALGFPIGKFLAKKTREELKTRQKWFKLIIVLCLIGGGIGLLIENDILMFSFFFIAIVTSMSLKK